MNNIIDEMAKRRPLITNNTDTDILKLDGGEAKVQLQTSRKELRARSEVMVETERTALNLLKTIDGNIEYEENGKPIISVVALKESFDRLAALLDFTPDNIKDFEE